MVSTTLLLVKPRPACSTFEDRNIMAMDMNCFGLDLLSLEVLSKPKLDVNDFVEQLQQCITGVLDKLAHLKRITKRSGKSSNQFSKALLVHRFRRQLEYRYCHNWTDANRCAYRAACRGTNEFMKDSEEAFHHKTKTTNDDIGCCKVI